MDKTKDNYMVIGKRGISGVVVAILIVLIAVISVSIFWIALRPAIERTTLQINKGEECLYLNLKIRELSTSEVKVFRDAGAASLKAVKVIINGTEAGPFTDYPLELETKTYLISAVKGDMVEVAGVLEGDAVCTPSDTKKVS